MQTNYEIILCINMNECVFDGKLQRILNNIGLIKVSSQFSNNDLLPPYISGSTQIDRVWINLSIMQTALLILSYYFSVRN